MSGKKRKLPTVKDEVFEDEIGNDDFMTKQFDDEGNSDSEYSISEGEEETEIPEDDSEDESDDEPDDKSAERGKSKQVNQKATGSKGAPKSKKAGNIPMNWYDEYPHMGYDLDGNPIIKPDKGDKLDQFLRMLEDPDHERAAYVARRAELIKKGMVTYKTKQKKKRFYDLWGTKGDDQIRRLTQRLETPKMPLPGHEDSYRAPLEYIKEYNARRFTSVRKIPQFYNFVKDRYERCLDLYLAPRKLIKKPLYKADDLLPRMPKPKDLRPFPTREALRFVGHQSVVRTISIHPLGKFLASGSDDHTVKIWEISTGRCLRTFNFQGIIKWVAWNPSPKLFLLAVVVGNKVFCLNPETYLTDRVVVRQTNAVFRVEPDKGDDQIGKQFERVRTAVTWRKPDATEWSNGIRVVLEHFKDVKQPLEITDPFTAIKARIEVAEFHPKLPFLYVVTQTHVRVYNLQKQTMLKNIRANSRWVSSISVHPGVPKEAVRKVAFHRKYPLFASASDDGRIIVSHGMVYNDWITDPLIVPVKELAGHWFLKNLCVLDIAWHPYEPFVLSSGADTTIRLWS
ncbi:putative ribosome biogenesis protein BOP1 [Penaeus vannamei]|uniref:Putative ribosome biogenesis protein BOP1 n=1 Tax=Penaeus vannamei TaxID=6689 RepID=A0A423TCY0_PENVA|nr:putative ribosome biogenesis protein BOP1 [Penaeus vannamei]